MTILVCHYIRTDLQCRAKYDLILYNVGKTLEASQLESSRNEKPQPNVLQNDEINVVKKIQENISEKPSVITRNQTNSDSSFSIDVLSGGESEYESLKKNRSHRADKLDKLMNNNNVSSQSDKEIHNSSRGSNSRNKYYINSSYFYICKELLMTERTYKRDLHIFITLFRDELSLHLEKEINFESLWNTLNNLSIHQSNFLHTLETKMNSSPLIQENNNTGDGSDIKNISKLDINSLGEMMLDYLQESLMDYNDWIWKHLEFIQKIEQVFANVPAFEKKFREIEMNCKSSYLPVYFFALKPFYRILHYELLLHRAAELFSSDNDTKNINDSLSHLASLNQNIDKALPNSLNLIYLFLLQRDIDGFENLVIPGRKFILQGCLFKYTSKGPQQRMFFLFSDILIYSNKSSSSQQQFKVHGVLPLYSIQVEPAEYTYSFSVYGAGHAMTLSAKSLIERNMWMSEIEKAAKVATNESYKQLITNRSLTDSGSIEELTDSSEPNTVNIHRNNTLSHVCWHRNTSLSWNHFTIGMKSHLSGYLLRKFKNSHGWQRLWVVFASFCLYFYKQYHDENPLASLPLLGYIITKPNEKDAINKDFVFKLMFKNHIYFFRAESEYTFNRWMEVIGSVTMQQQFLN